MTTAQMPAESRIAGLAQFFPAAVPVRLRVTVRQPAAGAAEEVVVEYATAQEVLFACSLPVAFGERLRLVNAGGSFDAEAFVVALQWRDGHTSVAARFAREVSNWVVNR